MFANNMILCEGIYPLHGSEKELLLMLRFRCRLLFPLMSVTCLFGKWKALAVNQALQAIKGTMP